MWLYVAILPLPKKIPLENKQHTQKQSQKLGRGRFSTVGEHLDPAMPEAITFQVSMPVILYGVQGNLICDSNIPNLRSLLYTSVLLFAP